MITIILVLCIFTVLVAILYLNSKKSKVEQFLSSPNNNSDQKRNRITYTLNDDERRSIENSLESTALVFSKEFSIEGKIRRGSSRQRGKVDANNFLYSIYILKLVVI